MSALAAMRRRLAGCGRTPAVPGNAAGFRALPEKRRDHGAITAPNGAGPLRRLAPTACVLLALVGPWPAAAQAQTVAYVGNVDQRATSTSAYITSPLARAQMFSTGSRSGGYPFQDVVLRLGNIGTGTLTVTIRESTTENLPSSNILYRLTNPASLVSGLNTFTAPPGATLQPRTSYFIVAQSSRGNAASWSRTRNIDDVDEGGAAGWAISFPYLTERLNGTWWEEDRNSAFMARIRGEALPPPPPTLVSNLESEDAGATTTVFSRRNVSQPFWTGSVAGGYTLDGIALHFDGSGAIDSGALTVTLRAEGEASRPGRLLHTLTNPSTVNPAGLNEFTAPEGVVLAADTQYHVVLENSSGNLRWSRALFGVDPGSEADWRIPGRHFQQNDGGLWEFNSRAHVMAVRGSEAPLPTVSVTRVASAVTEGEDAQFTVTRTEVTAGALTVRYSVSETGAMVASGEEGAKTVAFGDGDTEVTVTVPTVQDSDDEAYSEVSLTLTPDSDAYHLGSPAVAVVTVEDDDDAPLPTGQSALVGNLERFEGRDGEIAFTTQSLAQPFRTGSVTSGYTLQGIALRLDIDVGTTIDRRALAVTLRESDADGDPGNLLYTLTTPSSVNRNGVNEFTAPAGAFLAADTRYHVVLAYSSHGFIRWSLARTGEDAGAAAGWTIPSSRYRQRGGDGSWSSTSNSAQAMAVRGIETPLPTVSVERVAGSVEEGEDARFRVTRTVTTTGALTVAYSVSESRDMVAASDEGAKTVDFADGVTEVTVTVPTVDDSDDEMNSTVTLRLTDDDAYDVGTRSATVTVRDDDEPPTLVSNLDNPLSNFHGHGAIILLSRNKTLSQSFRTGSAASGYVLDGMALRFRRLSFPQPGRLTVTLRANDPDDKPGNVLHTLTNPSSLDYDGVNEFTVRRSVFLAANTRYHVVAAWNNLVGGPQWLKAVDDSLDPGSAEGWEIGTRHESSNSGQSWGGARSARLLIAVRGTEVPLPRVAVEPVASPVAEGEDAQFKVTRTVTTRGALTVSYDVSETGDVVASDGEGAQSVDFGDGETEVTVTVTVVDDTDHEADSTVTLTLTADAAYELGTEATAEVTVEDDDNAAPTGAPTIDDTTPLVGDTLTADESGIADADGLTGVTYAWRWLRVASDGTETEVGTGDSYTVVAADVGATLKVEVRYTDEDGTEETVESVVTAVANMPPQVMLVLTPDTITEGGTSTLTATLDRASPEDTVVTLQAAGSPLPLPVPLELTIRAGQTESQGDGLMLSPDDDDVDEPDRTLTFSGTAANSEGVTDPDPVTLTIRDDDDTPTVTLRLDPASISEDGEVSTVTASLDHPSSEATTVTVSVTAVAPATSSDYQLSSNVELTIAAGATDSTGAVTITGVDNSAAAPDKEVTVSATATNAHGITDPDAVTLRIRNDDGVPALSIADASVDEGDSGSTTLDFTVTLDRAATATVTVNWATSDGTATAGTDYTAATGSLTFDAGDSSRTVSVTVTDDNVDEPNETFTVTLAVQSGATIEDGTATGTITDDDATPTVTLTLTPDSIAENGGVSTVTAGLDHPSSQATTVTVTLTPVPPAVAGDYMLSTNRELTIAAGETGSTGVVTISPVNDQVDEPNKRVTVSATATNTLGITAPQDVTLTIRDDENVAPTGAPIINDTTPESGDTLTADTSGIVDSDGLTDATFRYLWFRVRGGETQVGTGDSYTVLDADVGRRLKVVVKYDDDGGTTETVESALTGTVTEPSVPPKLTLHLDPTSITEAGGTSTVTASLDRGAGREIVLRVEANAVSPATASDFTLSSNRTLRFPPGRTESTRRVTITAVDDAEDAPDKTVTVVAVTGSGSGDVSDPEPVTLTIEDDDDPPTGLSIRDASVDEGDSGDATMRFTVTLSPAATGTVTVDWATADGTATAGTDYTAGNGSLTFDDGDASKEVSVLVTGDNVDEPAETFKVRLSSAVGATIGDAEATGTIRDDDDAPTVTLHLDPASISENGGVSTVTASLDHPSSLGTTVFLSVTPVAPAVAGDYTLSTNLILIIQPGETESTGLVTITAVDNAVDAPSKAVTVSSNLVVNILDANDPEPVTLTIRDDENVAPTGAPTIDDTTPMVGETLTADASGIADPDGLTGATFTWQWIRVSGGTETPITGATTASYTVVAADVGAKLKVKATFTDDGGTTETLESAETGTVAAAAPPPPGDRVLVSNTSGDVLGTDSVTPAMAQPFTTGNVSGGYDLSSVVVAINSPGSDVRVTIRESEADGSPGDIVHTLINPPSDAGGGLHEYSAPAGATLEAATVYHVVAERISGAGRAWKVTDSGREDPGAAPGWEIGASFWILDGGRWRSFPSSLQIQIKGTGGNTDPTGAPTIDDTTPVEGETLTADPSGIADADGLTGATFTWQWIRVSGGTETRIAGATTASYTVVAADVGAKLKVEASFTDDGGTAETVESAATAAVAAFPEVTVASDGDVTEGSAAVFTLTRTGDRAQALDVAYEVTASGRFGVTTGAGTATFPAKDATVQVSLATTGDSTHEAHGSVTVTLQADAAYDLGADAAATATIRDDDDSPATGAVAITGTPTEGETLTADTSGLTDADGLANAVWAWQWVRTPSGGSDADITGATSKTYVPVFADAGATLKVRVTVTDDEGHEATFTSAATSAVAALPRPKVTLVLTPDTITEGGASTVTATLDRASSADTLVTVSVAGSPLPVSLRIRAGQTESQELMFSPHDNDMDEPDRTLTFSGTAANSEGVTDPDPVTLTVRDDDDTPTVTLRLDPASIGENGGVSTVTATLDHPSSEETTVTVTATPESPAVAGDYTLSGSRLTIAAGGTASTGTVTITAVDNAVDAPHKRVTVSATATNTQGITPPQDMTLTVTDDENVAPTGVPAIDDTTPVVGETLTADTSGIGDSDGLTSPTYAYQWIRVASDGTQTPIAGATGATYTVAAADVGATLKVRVTFTDEGGAEETIESAVTAAAQAATLPTVSVERVASPVEEGEDAQFRVTRTGITAGALTVNYDVSETGAMVASGEEGAKTVAFADGESEKTVTVPTEEDTGHEADSTVTLTLTADASYVLGSDATAEVAVEDDDNAAPTGAPTIDDTTPLVGEVLTADTSGIDDPDGLTNPRFTWQWIRTSGSTVTQISEATAATYAVVAADVDATLKVEVTFTDDDDTAETLMSAATSSVKTSIVWVTSEGDVTEGDPAVWTLERTGSATGMLSVKIGIRPSGGDFLAAEGGTTFPIDMTTEDETTFPAGSSATQVSLSTVDDSTHEADGTVSLFVMEPDDGSYSLGEPDEGQPEFAVLKIRDNDNAAPTGTVTIDNTTPVVGATLTADASGIDDPDGLTSPSFTWQWIRTSGGTATPISSATTASYTVVAADVGATLKVAATFTDDDGTQETVESAETATIRDDDDETPTPTGNILVSNVETSALSFFSDPASSDQSLSQPFLTGSVTGGYTLQSIGLRFNGTPEIGSGLTVTLRENAAGGSPGNVLHTLTNPDPVMRIGVNEFTAPAGVVLAADTRYHVVLEYSSDSGTPRWSRAVPGLDSGSAAGWEIPRSYRQTGGASWASQIHSFVMAVRGTEVASEPLPTVAVERVASPVQEGADAQFRVTRTVTTAGALTVAYRVSETGDMVASGEEGAKTVAFADGDTERTVTVPTAEDAVHEADSTVTVTLTADAAWDLGTASAEVTVEDDDNAAPTGAPTIDDTTPVVGETLTADPSGIGDPDGLTGVTYAWRWIRVAAGGAETEVGTGESYTVAAADVGATLKVEVSFTDEDGTAETLESAETTAVEAAAPTVPEVSIVPGVGGSLITEGGKVTFTLTISEPPAALLLVNLRVTETGDMMMAHNLQFPIVAVFPPGKETATLSYETVLDDTDEPNSTVTAEIVEREGSNYVPGTPSMASVEVRDDDRPDGNAAPTGAPTIDDTTPVVGETLTADPSGIDDPDGLAGPTYTWRWIRVAAGGAETVVGTGTTYVVVAADVGATLKVEATFTDDDGIEETVESAVTSAVEAVPLPTVAVERLASPVEEGADAQFRVTRTVTTAGALTVAYRVSETGDMVASGEEGAKTVAFADGDTERTVTVPTAEDTVHEADSTVTVTLTADAAWDLGTASAEVTVEDDDNAAPTGAPTIDDTTPVVGETLTADASGIVDADGLAGVTYAWRWLRVASDSTETEAGTGESYTVVVADVGATLKVEVSYTDEDGTTETLESVVTATVEALPALSIGNASVDEGDSGSATLDFTVTLDRAATATVTVDWATSDGTATAGTDYTAGNGTLTFNTGDSSRTVSVTVAGDNVDEPNETFEVTLTNPSGATLGDDTGTGTITDDDDTPTVTLSLDPLSISEKGGKGSEVTASLDHPSSQETTVTVTVTPVSPAVPGDYTLSGKSELTIPAGETDSDGLVTITAVDNAVDAPHKTVTVSATATNAQGITQPQDVTLTIIDDENVAPTGKPTIDDTTPMVGDTLTADTSGIGDSDGLASPTFTWQWFRVASDGVETPIAGATAATYRVAAADVGATLKVRVTFTDEGGAKETVESVVTTAVQAATLPTVSVARVASTVEEGAGAQFTVTRTVVTTGALTVRYRVSETGAMVASGEEGAKTVAFADGDTEQTVTVPTVEDTDHEADSTVTVTLTADAAYDLGTDDTATVTVEDNDNAAPTGAPTIDDTTPVVGETLTADESGIGDADGLTGATFTWQWVRVSGGTDTPIAGATTASYTVVAGDVGATLKVEASFTDDDGTAETVESAETATVEAAPLPTVSVAPVSSPVAEGAGAQFTVTRTVVTTGALTVRYRVSESGAMVASGEEGAKTVDFSGNAASVTVTVPTVEDSAHEADSTVTVTLTADAAYNLGTDATAEVTVEDNDNAAPTGAPTIDDTTPVVGQTLTANPSGIADADGLTGATFTWQWIRVASGGTETRISGATTASYTVVAGDVGATLKVEASFTDDGGTQETLESAETATVAAAPLLPTLSIGDASVDEGDSGSATLDFTVTLSRTATETVTVDWATADGTATAGTDYTAGNGALTFSIGDSSKTVSVTVTGDNVDEPNETFTVTLSSPSGATIGDGTATGTITDDDAAPKVTLMLSPGSIDEDGGTSTLTASLDRPSSEDTTVHGIGGVNVDAFYTVGPDPNPVLTIPAGETASTGTVTLTAVDNNVDAPDKRITVSAEASNSLGVTFPDDVTLTIEDDDDPPTVTLHLSPDTISEDGGTSTATASLSHPSGLDTTVTVTVVPVSPAVTSDYTLSSNVVLTIVAGAMDSTGTVTVTAVDNDVDAPDKTVTVWATTTNAHSGSVQDSAPLTIEDDDTTPTVTLHLSPDTISEDGGTSTVTARLDRTSSEVTTVTVSVAPVAPAVSGDYALSANRELRIAAGATTSTGTVTVTGVDNAADAPDKTVTVSGTATNRQGVTAPRDVALTIEDDDGPPTVTLVLTPVSIAEAGGVSTVTATLDRASGADTTVTVSVAPVSPTVASDYTLSANRELSIEAGATQSEGLVTIAAVDNDMEVPDRRVTVSGTAVNTQGVTAPRDVTLTIADDDGRELSIDDASVAEGDSGSATLEFTVTLAPAATVEVTVDWATADGTAQAGTDYTAGSGRLTFGAGEASKTVSVPATGNDVDEPDKTFTVTLSNASGAVLGDATGTGTIMDDDDAPTVTLVLTPASIVENGGVSTVTARLDHPSSEATTVTVSTAPVSPTVAGDYTLSAHRVLTVAAGATTSTGAVTVAGVDNDVEGPDKRVTVSGTATNGQGVTAPRDVTLTIVDDESVDERHRRLEYTLASFGRTMAQDLVTAIEDREWLASAGTTATLAGTRLAPDSFRPEEFIFGTLQRHVGPDGELAGTAALRELLSRSRFQLSLGEEGAGEASGPRAGSLVLWGRGSQSWSRGRLDEAAATRGEMLSGQVGLEYRLREDLLLGVMVNASDGALEFDETLATEVEAELVGVHPYARWSPGQGLRGWAMLGYGVGEATLADRFSALTETDIETDIEMMMAAAGGSHEVASRWGFDWSVGTNGFLVQFDADEREGLPAAVRSEVWQVRLLLEGSAGKELDGGAGLSGNVELAARVDGGDAETGLGMELGGGVAYGHLNLGIDVRASGRVLLSHEDGLEDAGMSLALEVDPGERGRGLYFTLAPSWGNTTSGARAMWEDRQASTGVPHGSDGRRFDPTMWLDSELGYTAPLPARRGTLTSYGAFSSDGGAARQYRIGRRLELADLLSMSFEAERRESAGVAPEHSIWLKNSIRF